MPALWACCVCVILFSPAPLILYDSAQRKHSRRAWEGEWVKCLKQTKSTASHQTKSNYGSSNIRRTSWITSEYSVLPFCCSCVMRWVLVGIPDPINPVSNFSLCFSYHTEFEYPSVYHEFVSFIQIYEVIQGSIANPDLLFETWTKSSVLFFFVSTNHMYRRVPPLSYFEVHTYERTAVWRKMLIYVIIGTKYGVLRIYLVLT